MEANGDRVEVNGDRASQPVYSIGAVARMLGTPAATLRTWQERYGLVVPDRSEGGHRLYSRDQVELLRFVVDRVDSGLSPADAHRLLRERLAGGGSDDPMGAGRKPARSLLILLAERDRYAAEFSEYFLRTEGYEVALALSAEATLEQFERTRPDLVVVDLMISAGQGLELCRRLAAPGHAPVLAVCTLALGEAAVTAGAAAFLPKPVEPLQFVSAVKDLLGQSAFLQREGTPP